MSEREEQIETIELSMAQAKSAIATMSTLNRLTANKDFEEIILKGYFEKEASRLVLLRADPSMGDEEGQKLIDNQIIAIGHLRQHFVTIMHFGRMATKELADDEETLDELLTEEGEA